MKYAGIINNDIANGEGFCVSFWVQGCPHKCNGCHNPETWDFNSGLEFTEDIFDDLILSINDNNIQRNFSILGGEPLCKENLSLVEEVTKRVRNTYPNIKIFLWTGYTKEYLDNNIDDYETILDLIDVLIDGPFILEKRDIRLKLRGSTNQRIWMKDSFNNWYIEES